MYTKCWHRWVNVDDDLHGCQHIMGRYRNQIGALWHSHAGSERCAPGCRLWWCLSPMWGVIRSLAKCLWIEDLCLWTTLYVTEHKEPGFILLWCGYLQSLKESGWRSAVWALLGAVHVRRTVCLSAVSLSHSSSLSCLPLHLLSLAGNNCLSSTQHFK